MTRSQIIRKVKRLYDQGKPLNITAVKRNDPQLMEVVYSQKKYWGWRGVIEAAGLNYADLKVELSDTCVCLICGYEGQILTSHLAAKHAITPQEYRQESPGAEIMCETIRSQKMGHNRDWPHWEPLYSREYCLDRMYDHAQRNKDMNYESFCEVDRISALAVLRFVGSWDEALGLIGLNAKEVRKVAKARSLSCEEVIRQLQAREAAGNSLSETVLAKEDLRLTNAMRRRFGSRTKALKAAGIDPLEHCRSVPNMTGAQKKRMIQRAREIEQMVGRRRYQAAIAFRKKYGKRLGAYGCSWIKFARAENIAYHKLSNHRYVEKEDVLEEMRKIVSKKRVVLNLYKTNRPLYNASQKLWGSYPKMLEDLK